MQITNQLDMWTALPSQRLSWSVEWRSFDFQLMNSLYGAEDGTHFYAFGPCIEL